MHGARVVIVITKMLLFWGRVSSLTHKSTNYNQLASVGQTAPYRKRGSPMRLVTFILSSAIALTFITSSASAASNSFRATGITNCPVYEGYPDCHPDGREQLTKYSNGRPHSR